MAFVLTQENASLSRFYFKTNRNILYYSKDDTRDFYKSPPFKISVCFYVRITGDFQHFQFLNFETSFMKKYFFRKVEYRFLVQSTTYESTLFSYKTALSKANVKY